MGDKHRLGEAEMIERPIFHLGRRALGITWRVAASMGIIFMLSLTSVWHVWLIEQGEDGFHLVPLPATYVSAGTCRVRSTSINNRASWPISACRAVLR